MATFGIDNSQVLDLEDKLRKFRKSGVPFATKQTLNAAAFEAMKKGKLLLDKKMVLRNKFTQKSLQIEKATGMDISRQMSIYGSTQDYMETQEFGGIKSKKGKHGVTIPTSFSAGQGMSARPRMRVPRKANQMSSIMLSNARKKGSRKQRNFLAIREAAASGRRFIYLELARSKGIFKVQGGAKKPRIKMLYNLSKSSVRIPATPWLRPSFDTAVKRIPVFYRRALQFQVDRFL